jgi:hypothetical protein
MYVIPEFSQNFRPRARVCLIPATEAYEPGTFKLMPGVFFFVTLVVAFGFWTAVTILDFGQRARSVGM